MQNFPVPKLSSQQWTEWFKGKYGLSGIIVLLLSLESNFMLDFFLLCIGFSGDENILRGDNYDAALGLIDSWIRSDAGMPKSTTGDLDKFFEALADVPVKEMLVTGQPWGALEELLLGKKITPGLTFTLPSKGDDTYDEAAPWIELLQDGTFSAETLSKLPLSYQTTDQWLAKLEESATKHGMTWLHALHISIAHIERGAVEYPLELLAQSMALKPNPIAARCMAVLQSTPEAAWPYFQQAWEIAQNEFKADSAHRRLTLNLVTEISFLLQQELWYDKMEAFVQLVNDGHYMEGMSSDAFTTLTIKVHLHLKQNAQAISILGSNCFPTYAKARDDLMSMWNTAVMGLAQQKKGELPLTYVEQHQARVGHPIPDNIGCQYASEVNIFILPRYFFLSFFFVAFLTRSFFFHLDIVLHQLLVNGRLMRRVNKKPKIDVVVVLSVSHSFGRPALVCEFHKIMAVLYKFPI
jgi:hypothetical protein